MFCNANLNNLPAPAHCAVFVVPFLATVILAIHVGYRIDVVVRAQYVVDPFALALALGAALTAVGAYLSVRVFGYLRHLAERRYTKRWLAFMNDLEAGRA